MSLGLNHSKPLKPFERPKSSIDIRMITTESDIPGFEIIASLGLVEGIAEIAMPGVALPHLELHAGGKLQVLVETARRHLAQVAGENGADAVLGFRYIVSGRDYEKSVLAFGTAITCRKRDQTQTGS